jgi:hypothetical protein
MAVRSDKPTAGRIRRGGATAHKDDASTVVTASLGDSISSTTSFCAKVAERSILRASHASSRRPSQPSSQQQVTWGHVEIGAHAYTLGDNPCVSSGPPVTMEWKAFETHCFPLDDYESNKPAPRPKEAMMLPRFYREELLRKQGCSRGELREAVEEVQRIQKNRKLSWSAKASLKFQRRWKNLTLKQTKNTPDHYF